ncbi:MAG: cold shock domain-containing protein [Lachnospiraceae bacterium]|nr:cold shock domain-containing protein [Lachnospiraceae bacterium]
MKQITGKVKWFRKKVGYGFISGDNGKDYFVHYTQIADKTVSVLERGQIVKFNEQIVPGKNLKAIMVEIVE